MGINLAITSYDQKMFLCFCADGKAGKISWNFEKFVIGPDGRVWRFSPRTLPDAPEVIEAIEAALPA